MWGLFLNNTYTFCGGIFPFREDYVMSVTYDVDSVGGGMGGLGGGSLPLWLLLFMNSRHGGLFGNDGNAQAFSDGAVQSKLDCLAQNQGNIADQIRQQADNTRFMGLAGRLVI